mmetsp:Transcript_8530/g.8383  ORF Transcript_8530/g.8383 Transcript_8530/m.8383 type:complete len:80 (-) Transcript_8530:133-372(-)
MCNDSSVMLLCFVFLVQYVWYGIQSYIYIYILSLVSFSDVLSCVSLLPFVDVNVHLYSNSGRNCGWKHNNADDDNDDDE